MKWIRVKDEEPPKDGSPFLGYDPNCSDSGRIYVLAYNAYRKKNKGCYCEASGEGYEIWEPTHWMPLPQAPKDKDSVS